MKKIFPFLIFSLFALAGNAQLLYKISGKGLKEPSYIVGTQHYARISFIDSIPGLRRVMDETQQVYGEINEDTTNNDQLFDQYAFMPEGVSFQSLFTPEELQRLHDYAVETCHLDSLQWKLLQDLTPAVVSHYLGLKRDNVQNTDYDDYFKKQALAQGKNVGGLETRQFSLEMLFGATLQRQKERLMCEIDNNFKNPDEKAANYYYTQDFKYIWECFLKSMNDYCYTQQDFVRMLDDRNADWLTKMPAIMQQKSTLFVVGIAHLPGDKGVLQLLKNAGYKVKAVKK